jgi:hypothetical protein
MIPLFLRLLLLTLAAMAPQPFSDAVPTVSIALPADVRSDTIQVHYFLSGSFGGYSSYVEPKHVSRAEPDNKGEFAMEVPDFAKDPHATSVQPSESLWLVLRDSKTLNPIAFNLEPERPEFRTQTNQLRIASTYPQHMNFLPSHQTMP